MLMGEIYKHAEKVIVWLGEWSPQLRQAVEIVKSIRDFSSDGDSSQENGRRLQTRNQGRARDLMGGEC